MKKTEISSWEHLLSPTYLKDDINEYNDVSCPRKFTVTVVKGINIGECELLTKHEDYNCYICKNFYNKYLFSPMASINHKHILSGPIEMYEKDDLFVTEEWFEENKKYLNPHIPYETKDIFVNKYIIKPNLIGQKAELKISPSKTYNLNDARNMFRKKQG